MTVQNPPNGTPKRICIQRLSHLGDVVHALPVFHALRARYPNAGIAWVVQPEFAGMLEGLPGLARVIPFERGGGLLAWWRLRRELRAFRADLAVDCQGNWKSGLATRLTGAKRRVGLSRGEWREPHASWCCNELATAAVQAGGHSPHSVSRMLHLASYIGEQPIVADSFPHPSFSLLLNDAEREEGELQARERLASTFPVILHLGAGHDPRSWGTSSFVELARMLASQGRSVLILSGPAEAQAGARVQAELAGERGVSHWVGQRGLRQLAAFFQAAAKNGARIVSADSGPMHLAWASGLPVSLLAGPQDASVTGPWPLASAPGSPHETLAADEVTFPCRPCLRRVCYEDRTADIAPCMRSITPADVLKTLVS
jgi:heptosyltransferase I